MPTAENSLLSDSADFVPCIVHSEPVIFSYRAGHLNHFVKLDLNPQKLIWEGQQLFINHMNHLLCREPRWHVTL